MKRLFFTFIISSIAIIGIAGNANDMNGSTHTVPGNGYMLNTDDDPTAKEVAKLIANAIQKYTEEIAGLDNIDKLLDTVSEMHKELDTIKQKYSKQIEDIFYGKSKKLKKLKKEIDNKIESVSKAAKNKAAEILK